MSWFGSCFSFLFLFSSPTPATPRSLVYQGLENVGLEGKEANELSSKGDWGVCCRCFHGAGGPWEVATVGAGKGVAEPATERERAGRQGAKKGRVPYNQQSSESEI